MKNRCEKCGTYDIKCLCSKLEEKGIYHAYVCSRCFKPAIKIEGALITYSCRSIFDSFSFRFIEVSGSCHVCGFFGAILDRNFFRSIIDSNEKEISQTLAVALGYYPYYCDDQKNFPDTTKNDGVCIGDHTSITLSDEASDCIIKQREEIKKLRKKISEYKKMVERLREK